MINSINIKFKKECFKVIALELKSQQHDNNASLKMLMDSKLNETKSSAGDKYETGMAMIQNEERLYLKKQNQINSQLHQLNSLNVDTNYNQANRGALIHCNTGIFYISVALGTIEVDDKKVHCISIESPLAVALKSLKAGDSTIINGNAINIIDLC